MISTRFLVALLAVACFAVCGCDNTASKGGNAEKSSEKEEHGHDHDHDHDHDHGMLGKNRGHVYKFDTKEMRLEWAHSKSNNKFFLVDLEGNNKPMKVDSFEVVSEVGSEPETFNIPAVDANDKGETAQYTLDSEELSRAIPLGVSVKVKVGDKTYTAKIDAHEPHSH